MATQFKQSGEAAATFRILKGGFKFGEELVSVILSHEIFQRFDANLLSGLW